MKELVEQAKELFKEYKWYVIGGAVLVVGLLVAFG